MTTDPDRGLIQESADHHLRQLALDTAQKVARRAKNYADRGRSSMPIQLEEIAPLLYVVHETLMIDTTLERGQK